MSEYWQSTKRYFCNYCKIYITDDKPSRAQHENGLKHKGNVERYIKNLYKKGAIEKREKAEEASVVAAINAAVGAPAPEPSTSGSQGKKKPQPAKASDPYANYSHAATLNMVDQEYEDAVKASKEAQTNEGNVGKWEAVGTTAPAASTSSSAGLMADPEAHLSASQREEMRPSSKTFKEKTIDDDELWDPATTIRLKPKPAVKKEESPAPVASGSASASGSGSATPAEGEKKPKMRAGFRAAFNKVASNSPGPEVARDSPLAQEDTPVKAEPQHTVEPPVQAAAPTAKEESPEAKPSPAELDNAESSLSDMAPRSMFKKRKAGGSSSGAAQRRKM